MKSVLVSTICIVSLFGLSISPICAEHSSIVEFKNYLTPITDTAVPAEKIRLPQDKIDPIQLKDPSSVIKTVRYDEKTNRYILEEKIGDDVINSTNINAAIAYFISVIKQVGDGCF